MIYNCFLIFKNGREVRLTAYSLEFCEELMNCIRIKSACWVDNVLIDGESVCYYYFEEKEDGS